MFDIHGNNNILRLINNCNLCTDVKDNYTSFNFRRLFSTRVRLELHKKTFECLKFEKLNQHLQFFSIGGNDVVDSQSASVVVESARKRISTTTGFQLIPQGSRDVNVSFNLIVAPIKAPLNRSRSASLPRGLNQPPLNRIARGHPPKVPIGINNLELDTGRSYSP